MKMANQFGLSVFSDNFVPIFRNSKVSPISIIQATGPVIGFRRINIEYRSASGFGWSNNG